MNEPKPQFSMCFSKQETVLVNTVLKKTVLVNRTVLLEMRNCAPKEDLVKDILRFTKTVFF